MAVLKYDEVSIRRIQERFERDTGKYHPVSLRYPTGIQDSDVEGQLKLHPEDWTAIFSVVSQDYAGSDYPLIAVWAAFVDRVTPDLMCKVWTNAYRLK